MISEIKRVFNCVDARVYSAKELARIGLNACEGNKTAYYTWDYKFVLVSCYYADGVYKAVVYNSPGGPRSIEATSLDNLKVKIDLL